MHFLKYKSHHLRFCNAFYMIRLSARPWFYFTFIYLFACLLRILRNQEKCKWYLNGFCVCFDFAPGHRLIGPSPRVAAIGLLSRVHIHGKISPTPLKEDKPVYKSRAEREVRKITQFVICLLSQRAPSKSWSQSFEVESRESLSGQNTTQTPCLVADRAARVFVITCHVNAHLTVLRSEPAVTLQREYFNATLRRRRL